MGKQIELSCAGCVLKSSLLQGDPEIERIHVTEVSRKGWMKTFSTKVVEPGKGPVWLCRPCQKDFNIHV